jgi:hypothetical protein
VSVLEKGGALDWPQTKVNVVFKELGLSKSDIIEETVVLVYDRGDGTPDFNKVDGVSRESHLLIAADQLPCRQWCMMASL